MRRTYRIARPHPHARPKTFFYNCLPSWSSFLVLVHRHRVEDLRRFVVVPLNGLYQSQIYFMSRSYCATGVSI